MQTTDRSSSSTSAGAKKEFTLYQREITSSWKHVRVERADARDDAWRTWHAAFDYCVTLIDLCDASHLCVCKPPPPPEGRTSKCKGAAHLSLWNAIKSGFLIDDDDDDADDADDDVGKGGKK